MNTEKKQYVGNSLFNHIRYKIWLWNKFYPLLFYRLGFQVDDFIIYNSSAITAFDSSSYLASFTNLKIELSEGKTKSFIDKIEKNELGVDELIDPFSGQRLIHYAIIFNEISLVDYLIQKDCNLMVRDYLGYTPLFKAASLGRSEIFKILIDSGVPLNHYDRKGKTPKSKAELFNQDDIISYIISLNNDKINNEKTEYWLSKPLNEKYKTSTILHKVLF